MILPVAPAPATAPPAAEPPPPPPAGGFLDGYGSALLGLFNSTRADYGLGAVSPNAELTAAAAAYADLVYHADPYALSHHLDGGPGDRAARQGYWGTIGEIIATAGGTPEYFLELWLNSPPHRAIILDGQFVDVGVDCYQGPSSQDPVLCVAMFGVR